MVIGGLLERGWQSGRSHIGKRVRAGIGQCTQYVARSYDVHTLIRRIVGLGTCFTRWGRQTSRARPFEEAKGKISSPISTANAYSGKGKVGGWFGVVSCQVCMDLNPFGGSSECETNHSGRHV